MRLRGGDGDRRNPSIRDTTPLARRASIPRNVSGGSTTVGIVAPTITSASGSTTTRSKDSISEGPEAEDGDAPQSRMPSLLSSRASGDPVSFLTPFFLDEVQFAPEILPAIKRRVDRQPDIRGQCFLTGSQNLAVHREVAGSLAGRAGIVELPAMTPPGSLRSARRIRPTSPFPRPSSRRVPSSIALRRTSGCFRTISCSPPGETGGSSREAPFARRRDRVCSICPSNRA